MQYIYSIILGLVQGLTEFLPVSSSGHLLVVERLLSQIGYNAKNAQSLLIMLHFGTLFAVMIYFFKDWLNIILHPIKNNTLGLLIFATLPAIAAKLLLGDKLDALLAGRFLGPGFIITALFLIFADKCLSKKPSGEVNLRRAGIMGLFQAFAILPGVSRSGSTIFGGILSGNTRSIAAKFSFLMSAPVIFGGFVLEVKDAAEAHALSSLFSLDILLGILFAFISGYFAIGFMIKKIERVKLSSFSKYLIVLGILVIICQISGFLGFERLF